MAITFKNLQNKIQEGYKWDRDPASQKFADKHTVDAKDAPLMPNDWAVKGVKGKDKSRKADRQPGEDASVNEDNVTYDPYNSLNTVTAYEDDAEPNDGYDSDESDESDMAKNQLNAIAGKAARLSGMMVPGIELEAWVQSKIAQAKMMIDDIYDHVNFSEEVEEVNEVITKKTSAGEVIKDFQQSKNPKFAGKSPAKRKQMALAAYYSKQNEEVEQIDEAHSAVTVKTSNHHWGKMITVHHKASHSFPLHPEHQEAIRKLKDGDNTSFKDETGSHVSAKREGNKIHLKHRDSSTKSTVDRHHFAEECTTPKEHKKIAQFKAFKEERLDEYTIRSAGHEKVQVVHKGKVVKTFKDPHSARMHIAKQTAPKDAAKGKK